MQYISISEKTGMMVKAFSSEKYQNTENREIQRENHLSYIEKVKMEQDEYRRNKENILPSTKKDHLVCN